jgi:hypothetical protein
MTILSRVVLAGLACASLGAGAAQAQAAGSDANTGGRFMHAGKCVVTLGFAGECDKDTATPKKRAASTTVDTSTRGRFVHASECVITVGFAGGCDKDVRSGSVTAASAPSDTAAPSKRADATPDTSTRHQFLHAGKCVVTLGFGGNCDNK